MVDQCSVTVVRDGLVWTGGADPKLLPRHDVVIVGGAVATLEPNYRGRVDCEIDAGGAIVVPGFINAHVHPGTSPRSRGLAEDAEIAEDGAYYHVTLADPDDRRRRPQRRRCRRRHRMGRRRHAARRRDHHRRRIFWAGRSLAAARKTARLPLRSWRHLSEPARSDRFYARWQDRHRRSRRRRRQRL